MSSVHLTSISPSPLSVSLPALQLVTALREHSAPILATKGGKVAVQGSAGSNAQHTMSEDERSSFTNHINGVSPHNNQERAR